MHTRHLFLIIASFLLLVASANGQNNKYKIDDEVYQYYLRAQKISDSKECIAVTDSGLVVAKKKGDLKGECVLLCTPLHYYYKQRDEENIHKLAEELRERALETGYTQYYYYAYIEEITTILNNGKVIPALNLADEMRQKAEQANDDYGMVMSYKNIANIHKAKGDVLTALKYYKQALDVFLSDEKLIEEQGLNDIYKTVGDSYEEIGKPDSAIVCYNEALKNGKDKQDSIKIYKALSYLYAGTNDKDNFYRYFNLAGSSEGFFSSELIYPRVMIYDAVKRGNIEEAKTYVDPTNSNYNSSLNISFLYETIGDYQNALKYYRRCMAIADSLESQYTTSTIDEYSSLLGSDKIRIEAEHKQNVLWKTIFALFFVILAMGFIASLHSHKKNVQENRKLKELNERISKTCNELIVAREKAEAGSKMKTAFVQNMSHEVRTPLNAILGFSQLLSLPDGMLSDSEKAEYFKYVQDNSDVLTMLIDDLLDISDVEAGKFKINIEKAPCNEICRNALKTVESRTPNGVRMYMDSELGDDFSIMTDRRRVKQVLINYLTNACKNTTSGEIHLHCSTSENPGKVTFSVTDTGCGVPPDKAEEIFERFTKLDAFKQGAGLGLSICRTIAVSLGAEVKLDQNYKNGARFLLILPLNGRD